jgi:excisionase family DNA binding protein
MGETMRRGAALRYMNATAQTPMRPAAAEAAPFKLLDTNECAAALGIGRRTLQERVAACEIAVVKIGKSVRFHPDDIAAFVERNRRKARGWKGGAR